MKKIKLWKWPEEGSGRERCKGCHADTERKCLQIRKSFLCGGCIWKTEKPEPEFIEVEVGE